MNASTLKATEEAFNTRELLKVRVLENAPQDTRETGQALAEQLEDTQIVRVIGRVVVLYRPDPDAPEIRLPG